MNIEQAIASWDGRSAADIQAIYDEYKTNSRFAEKIVTLSLTEVSEKGATWLLKAWLEDGNQLSRPQIGRLVALLDRLQHWEAKLHVLQSLPYLSITEAECHSVYVFLKHTLTDQNKFVRAWSYNGFYELSRQHSKYKDETKQYFEMAMRDEAPSVKARIRNLMKNGF